MNDKRKNWLSFDRYAIFGVGKSGIAAANLLKRRQKSVLASDNRPLDKLDKARAALLDGVDLVGGGNVWQGSEVVVTSPGLPPRLSVFKALRAEKLPIISEIELAFDAAKSPVIAITGTDGKSTTTVLLDHILASAGVESVAGGNLGTPLCDLVEGLSAEGYLVAEVSAFQLWTTHHFKPAAIGLTNIAADHLDYFDTFDEYIGSKRSVLKNADHETIGVFNMEDAYIREWFKGFKGRAIAYGLSEEAVAGAEEALWFDDDQLSARLGGEERSGWLNNLDELPFTGPHNLLNLMCAAGLAQLAGVTLEQVADAARNFKSLAHRLEFVAEIDGVRFYDDSKATNAHAALAGLRAFIDEERLVPIVGGVDKGLSLDELVAFLGTHAHRVVLIGELAARLARELESAGVLSEHLIRAADMDEAVERAKQAVGQSGASGVVSLSPASSSFDMFQSFAHRGEVFQRAVRALNN